MKWSEVFKKYIDLQYSKPAGLIGAYIGEKMVRQHKPETYWTLQLLEMEREDRILEIGCGAGYAIKRILQQNSIKGISGIDISRTVLKSAKTRNKHEISKGRASFFQANVHQIPFEKGEFSKVFSIHSIYFWEDVFASISEIYRVMTENGTVVFTLCNGKNGIEWSSVTNLLKNEIIPTMHSVGFTNIEILEGPDSREYQTIALKAFKESC